MFSNKYGIFFRFIVVGMFIHFSLGCMPKIGEQPPPPANHEFGGTMCLSQTGKVIELFLDGEASNKELASSWDCMSGAVEKFKRYVRGRSANEYTVQELATFLENNFLDKAKARKISPNLQREFMKIKQIFIGGSSEILTREELDKIIYLLKSLKSMTLGLNPYMKLASLNWSLSDISQMEADVRFFENANLEIQKAAHTLASLIENNGQTYKISDINVFLEELDTFYGENWEFPKTIAKYVPIVKKVKKALAGGNESSITPNEWRRFSLLGARGFVQFLRYHYFIKSVPETGSGYRLTFLSRTAEDIFSVFHDLVAEKPEGIVSVEEVTDLFKTMKIIWPKFKVSSQLVSEFMKMKQLFFGGGQGAFTKEDFESARLKVPRIRALVENFLPYYNIYGKDWDPRLYDEGEAIRFFNEAAFVLEATTKEAGALFEGDYDLKDFVALLHEIEILYPAGDGESWELRTNKWMPLIVDLKNLILNEQGTLVHKQNWRHVLPLLSRVYSNYLFYSYFIEHSEQQRPSDISLIETFFQESFDVVVDILFEKKDHQFSVSEINKILRHLQKLEVLPPKVKSGSLDAAVRVAVSQVLNPPEQRVNGYEADSFSLLSVEILKAEIAIWVDAKKMLAQLFVGHSSGSGVSTRELIQYLKGVAADDSAAYTQKTAARELILSLDLKIPMVFNEQDRLVIYRNNPLAYNLESLNKLNTNRALARLFVRSFAKTKERVFRDPGLTLDEVEGAFTRLRPLAVDLGFLEEKNLTFASSRFREANIFMPHSDGNAISSFGEIMDIISMIRSGLTIDKSLHEDLVKVCFAGMEPGRAAKVSTACARQAYKPALLKELANLPEYGVYTRKIAKDDWAFYMNNVFKAAGYISNENNLIRLEDLTLVPHVIQYIEMIYARFDANNDSYISTEEAIKAYPSFKGILLELGSEQIKSGALKESELLDLFTYILRHGKPPETITEKMAFVMTWKGRSEKWDVWADRGQLAQIMGYISEKVNASGASLSFVGLE